MIRVVIADDNDLLRAALAETLDEDPGIEVVGQAIDGRAACLLVHALRPHVVLMDVRMPVMTGPQATAWISAAMPEVSVVGLTSHDDAEVHEAMRRAGALDVLVKGVTVAELVAAVERAARSGDNGPTANGEAPEEPEGQPYRRIASG